MTDWTLTAGEGDWIVATCACGFGGGDDTERFPSEVDAVDYMHWIDQKSDSSVVSLTDPDGEPVDIFDGRGLLRRLKI